MLRFYSHKSVHVQKAITQKILASAVSLGRIFSLRASGLTDSQNFANKPEPIVELDCGKLRGKQALDINGNEFFSFQGIPYAKPPLENLRFKPPVEVAPWWNIRNALQEGPACYSRHMFNNKIVGSEDCLYVNVYTSQLPSAFAVLKPVMVWIHGGAFVMGSSSTEYFGPEFLVAEDIVLVTFNYRLGALGFLSFQDPSLGVTGNVAFKDMVFVLQWVQKNIRAFNGDPFNVTVFGESAGAASVHYLMLSPMAKGLFHRAIVQSGSALSSWSEGKRFAQILAKKLSFKSTEDREVLKYLQKLPMEDLFAAQEKLPNPTSYCGAVIEPAGSEASFLSKSAKDIIASGEFHKVPLMIGYTNREGMLFEVFAKMTGGKVKMVTDFENEIPPCLSFPKGSEKAKEVAARIKAFYYGSEEPTYENIDKFYQLASDSYFIRGIHMTVKNHLEVADTPIYLYRFSVESKLNLYKVFGKINHPGACHADDLGYLFTNMYTPTIQPNSLEDVFVRRITRLWTNFAKKGDPNPKGADALINVMWEPATKGQHYFLDIGENLTVGINPEEERMTFWDEIYNLKT